MNKKHLAIGMVLGVMVLCVLGFVPSLKDFDHTQFSGVGNVVTLTNGVRMTNAVVDTTLTVSGASTFSRIQTTGIVGQAQNILEIYATNQTTLAGVDNRGRFIGDGSQLTGISGSGGINPDAGFGTNITLWGDANATNKTFTDKLGWHNTNLTSLAYVNIAQGNYTASGSVTPNGSVISGGSVRAAADGSDLGFTSSSHFRNAGPDGVMDIANNANTDFFGLFFGGRKSTNGLIQFLSGPLPEFDLRDGPTNQWATLGIGVLNVKATLNAATNTANFTLTTNDFVLNQFYTNLSQRAFVGCSIALTPTASLNAQVGLWLDQTASGTFNITGRSVQVGAGLTSTNIACIYATLQPGARFLFTNLCTGSATAAIVNNSSQWTKE